MQQTSPHNYTNSNSHTCAAEDLFLDAKTRDNSSPLLPKKPKTRLSKKSSLFKNDFQPTLEVTAEITSVESIHSVQAKEPSTCPKAASDQPQGSKKTNPKNEIERKKKTELCRNYMRTGICKYQNEVSPINFSVVTRTAQKS